jgi:hypothetical protein
MTWAALPLAMLSSGPRGAVAKKVIDMVCLPLVVIALAPALPVREAWHLSIVPLLSCRTPLKVQSFNS